MSNTNNSNNNESFFSKLRFWKRKSKKTNPNSNSSATDVEAKKQNDNKKKRKAAKKKFVMPPSLIIVFSLLLFVVFLTWVVPHASYSELVADGSVSEPSGTLSGMMYPANGKYGILDIGYAMFYGLIDAISVVFYILILGAFLQIIIDTKSLDAGIGAILRKAKGRELVTVPIMFIFFAVFGSLYGMQEETLGYFAIMIPFMVMAGFNTLTATLIMLLGTCTGIAASTTNPFSVGIAVDAANSYWQSIAGDTGSYISNGDTLKFSAITWVVFVTIGSIFVTMYAKKAQDRKREGIQKEYEIKAEQFARMNYSSGENYTLDKRRAFTLAIFGIAFTLMVMGTLPWGDFFPNYDQWVKDTAGQTAAGTWWLSSLMSPFGYWGFVEFCTVFIFAIIAVLITWRYSMQRGVELIFEGMKSMIAVAFVIVVARSISIVLTYSGLTYAFVNAVTQNAGGNLVMFSILMFIVFFAVGIMIPSTSSSASIMFPILAPIILEAYGGGVATDPYGQAVMGLMIVIYAMGLGMANMVTPVQAVTVASAELSGVSYTDMLKPAGAYVGILSVTAIGVLIPLYCLMI